MADALDSKSSVRKDVRVQVPPPVLVMRKGLTAICRKSFFFPGMSIQWQISGSAASALG